MSLAVGMAACGPVVDLPGDDAGASTTAESGTSEPGSGGPFTSPSGAVQGMLDLQTCVPLNDAPCGP